MKRTTVVLTGFVVLVSLALAFVAPAAPAAANPCLGLGEYYTFARDCVVRDTATGVLPALSSLGALAVATLATVSLRQRVLRLRVSTGRARLR